MQLLLPASSLGGVGLGLRKISLPAYRIFECFVSPLGPQLRFVMHSTAPLYSLRADWYRSCYQCLPIPAQFQWGRDKEHLFVSASEIDYLEGLWAKIFDGVIVKSRYHKVAYSLEWI